MDKKVDIAHPKVVRGMKSVSKAVIIVPLILFFLALIFHFYSEYQERQRARVAQFRAEQLRLQQEKQASFTASLRPEKEYDISIDLEGTYTCEYADEEASVSGKIVAGDASFQVIGATQSAYLLVEGDCAYTWDTTNTGRKVCGISQYRDLASMFAGFGFFDPSMILAQLSSSIQNPVSSDEALIPKTLEQCKEATNAGTLLEVPQSVVFTEESLDQEGSQEGDTDQQQQGMDTQQLMQMFKQFAQ